MTATSDFLVVGGGLIGLLTAYELSQLGHSVTVLDRQEAGKEASWAGGGILWPLYPWHYPEAVVQLALWGQRAYPSLLERLYEETEIDPHYQHSGLIVLDTDQFMPGAQWARRCGVRHELVSRYLLEYAEPGLRRPHEGLLFPHVGQVRNPRLVAALRKALLQRGVGLHEQHAVQGFKYSGERVTGVKSAQGEFHAAQVIVTAGAWSGQLLEGTGWTPKVRPVRGQMLLLDALPHTLQHIVLFQGRYLIPRRDGPILVGSTLEETGFDKSVTDEAKEDLIAFARALMPGLAQARIGAHWAGLRPGTEHGVPLVGPHPRLQGMWINAGHFRNGVVMAPSSVRLLLDQIFQRSPIVNPAPYLPR